MKVAQSNIAQQARESVLKTISRFNHKVGTDFTYTFTPLDHTYTEIKKSCGCSNVSKNGDELTLTINADKFKPVKDNVPSVAYKHGKDFYIKRVSVTLKYDGKRDRKYEFEITVTE